MSAKHQWKTLPTILVAFVTQPVGPQARYEAGQTLAAAGKTLGLIEGNWIIGLLKQKNPNGRFTMTALSATDDPAAFIMPAAAGTADEVLKAMDTDYQAGS
jgi:hypothetical protein